MRNLFFIVLTLLQVTSALAQATRQVEIKATDERGQPLAGADVVLIRTASQLYAERSVPSDEPATYEALGKTDATGVAVVDVALQPGDEVDDPLSIYLWKSGYVLRSAMVMKKAELQCLPLSKRTIRVVDAQENPLRGLRVSHKPISPNLPLCPDEVLETDEFGIVRVSAPASGGLAFNIQDASGLVHDVRLTEVLRITGSFSDPRDTAIVRMSPYGKIEGKLPSGFGQGYRVRFYRELANASVRIPENWTTLNESAPLNSTAVDQDGRFHFDAVGAGAGWVMVYRAEPMTAEAAENATSEPAAIHPVEVKAGETSMVDVKSLPTAKVSGRIVSTAGAEDFSGTKVLISRKFLDAGKRTTRQFPVATAVAAADGSFVCRLSVGTYSFAPAFKSNWKINKPVDFEVGAGAATIATNDISVTPLKKAMVRWQQKPRHAYSILNPDNRITFSAKDQYMSGHVLTEDGYAKVYLPSDLESPNIYGGAMFSVRQGASAFRDLDPSENFDLELIDTPQGSSSNVGMHGRVVDVDGRGLSKVPVSISLRAEPLSGAASRIPLRLGSQLLETWVTDDSGSFAIPPRQILRRIVLSGNSTAEEHRFTFTVSTPANPEPIEVSKVITVKPEQWTEKDIELPDLVVDRPLGGNQLSGKLLTNQGQPSTGERLWLADKRHTIRVFSDREGQFSIDDVAGPTWLLREQDWTIRAVNDYSQPLVCEFRSQSAAPLASEAIKKRLDRDKRRQLARELLQAVPAPNNMVIVVGGVRVQGLMGDAFYLEPEKTFEQLLSLRGPEADNLRIQYLGFWTNTSDAQLRQLAEVISPGIGRVRILRMLAERNPSIEAYEKLMNDIEYPETSNARVSEAAQLLDQLAFAGVKLHIHGVLEPYREKIRQFLDRMAADKQQPPRNPAGNQVFPPAARTLPTRDQTSLKICNALLEPEQYATSVIENMTPLGLDINSESRMAQMEEIAVLLQLYPSYVTKFAPASSTSSMQSIANWGETAPLEVVEACRQGMISKDQLRIAVSASLVSRQADAEEAFEKYVQMGFRNDSLDARLAPPSVAFASINPAFSTSSSPELAWYSAARRVSPQLGRVAAWQLASDYFSGRYEATGINTLTASEGNLVPILQVAYCAVADYPEVAQHLADRALPRLLSSVEQEFGNMFPRNGDLSLAAWFDPQAATDLVIKLKKQLDEEQKNRPANQRALPMSTKQVSLMSLRMSCLRGLLLDEL